MAVRPENVEDDCVDELHEYCLSDDCICWCHNPEHTEPEPEPEQRPDVDNDLDQALASAMAAMSFAIMRWQLFNRWCEAQTGQGVPLSLESFHAHYHKIEGMIDYDRIPEE